MEVWWSTRQKKYLPMFETRRSDRDVVRKNCIKPMVWIELHWSLAVLVVYGTALEQEYHWAIRIIAFYIAFFCRLELFQLPTNTSCVEPTNIFVNPMKCWVPLILALLSRFQQRVRCALCCLPLMLEPSVASLNFALFAGWGMPLALSHLPGSSNSATK